MGFQPWVPQQDTNTEIRVAMLLSLILQVALIFLGPMRKRSSVPRFFIWSCYLLADWVADLALGLLLNNMGNIGGGNSSSSFGINHAGARGKSSNNSGSPIIFAFWTPFLLLHLGGPDTITAYSVEDNELWLRHLIGLLFELFSALVIFSCSLRGNPMIGATVLVFVAGIIKYGERTYSLYSGSIKSFRANIIGPGNPGPNYAKLMTAFDTMKYAGLVVENREASDAQKDAEEWLDMIRVMSSPIKNMEVLAYDIFMVFRRLFVDLILNSQQRKMSQALFLEYKDMNPRLAFEIIESELDFIYDMVYTKAPVAYTKAGWVLRSICSGCIASATIIFFVHDKRGMKRVDVVITYALLLGGMALDMAALSMLLFSNRASVFFHQSHWPRLGRLITSVATKLLRRKRRRWSQSLSQFNLIRYALGKPYHYKGRFLLAVAKTLRVEEALEDLIFVEPSKTFEDLLWMVFKRVRDAARELGDKHDEIAEVFNCRGSRVLHSFEDEIKRRLSPSPGTFELIMESVAKTTDFDQSLLVWHIATDLCLLKDKQYPLDTATMWNRDMSITLSEYMMYLLIKQPEMLSARTGTWLMRYQDTCAEARRFVKSMGVWIKNDDDARKMLLAVNTSKHPTEVKAGDRSMSVLFDACILAKALRELVLDDDEELLWRVVAGVWVEMLTYAARKCPGSTHVRQLNRGGELITLIWFLMEHMGLCETLQSRTAGFGARLLVHDQ